MSEDTATSNDSQQIAVFLRGDRDYVQGTQMLARAAEHVSDPAAQIHWATFHRISARSLAIRPLPAAAGDESIVGQVEFSGDPVTGWAFVELDQPAPQLDRPMGVRIEQDTLDSPLNGSYWFDVDIADLESMLNVLVQAIKSLHQELDPLVHDVWFTGMRRLALPVAGWPLLRRGRVRIARRRVGRAGEQYQSLVEVVIEDESGTEMCRGFVNFAFKSPKVLHVH